MKPTKKKSVLQKTLNGHYGGKQRDNSPLSHALYLSARQGPAKLRIDGAPLMRSSAWNRPPKRRNDVTVSRRLSLVRHFGFLEMKWKKITGISVKPIFTTLITVSFLITFYLNYNPYNSNHNRKTPPPLPKKNKPVVLQKVTMAGKVDNFVDGGPPHQRGLKALQVSWLTGNRAALTMCAKMYTP